MFEQLAIDIEDLTDTWAEKLASLPRPVITKRRNAQNRSIKQIVGHMVDSATNNTHRVVHLQNGAGSLHFPNYATHGNNDRWIAIQNYQDEDWQRLVGVWKYTNLHYAHIIRHVDKHALGNVWIADEATGKEISLEAMIVDYLRHFKLHLDQVQNLLGTEYFF